MAFQHLYADFARAHREVEQARPSETRRDAATPQTATEDSAPLCTHRGSRVFVVALVLLGYTIGTATLAWVRMPQSDEGHFANAGYELAYHGRLAMPMWTAWVPTLDHHMYVQMPLYYVQLAPWIRAFGVDLRVLRLNSLLWGAVFVLAWYLIISAVCRDQITSLLCIALIGLNYDVMNMTSARYDAMCAALSAVGLACYVSLRDKHLTGGVLAANVCLAAALMTHPFGLFGIVGVVVFFVVLDGRRVSLASVAAAILPYAVAFGAWGLYILQDPADFKRQLAANAQGRLSNLSHPVQVLMAEIRERYLVQYAGWRSDVPPLMRIKVLFLAAYVAGLIGCFLTPRLRAQRGVMALAIWAVLSFGLLTVVDSNRWYIYLLYVLPIFTAILAVWFGVLRMRGPLWRHAVIAATAASILFSAGAVALRARLNDYGRLFAPTLSYLQEHVRDGDLIMAGGEFGPGLGFSEHVLEDPTFGFRNGREPDWIVNDKLHDERMKEWAGMQPALYRHVREMLDHYQLVFDRRQPYNYYRVYRRSVH